MNSVPPNDLGPILTTAGQQLIGAKYATTATFFLFAYDHLVTFSEEIEYIWKRKFSAVTLFFFINRYYALCLFTFSTMGVVLPQFSQSDCKVAVVLVPFMSGIPMTIFPDIVIGIRVYALYGRNNLLGLFLSIYVLAELGVALWLYITPSLHSITLPGPPDVNDVPVLHDCFSSASASFTPWQAASYQFMQSGYDTVAFLLIVYKSFSESRGSRNGSPDKRSLRYLMAKDGTLYYAVAFLCNLTWALMIVFAPVDVKYSAAEPAMQLVCMSVNRLTLSLRSFQPPSEFPQVIEVNQGHGRSSMRYRTQVRRASWIGTSTFEIGSDFEQKALDFGDVPSESDTSNETIRDLSVDEGGEST